MRLFERQSEQADTDAIDALQAGEDVKMAADMYLDEQINTTQARGEHIWMVDEPAQIRLAQAALSASLDHVAESLRGTAVYDRSGRARLPADVARFAANFSEYSTLTLDDARTHNPGDDEREFNEDIRQQLFPHSQMPQWPAHPGKNIYPEDLPFWQDSELGTASDGLIRSIAGATLQQYTNTSIRAEQLPGKLVIETPGYLTATYDVVNNIILPEAFEQSQRAVDIMNAEHITDDSRIEAYDLAHDGLVKIVHANMALYAPPMLGGEFRNQ